MSKSVVSAPALAGKTANELRELLSQKSVTKAQVVAFLREREAERGSLRAPSAKLLKELTGAEAPKAEKVVEPTPAKPESAKLAPEATVIADLLAQVRALTERIAALEGAKPESVVEVKPAKAKPESVVEVAKADDRPTEAEVRSLLGSESVKTLRQNADFPSAGMSKQAIIDAMVAQAIEEGYVASAAPVKPGKPDLKVVRATEVTF